MSSEGFMTSVDMSVKCIFYTVPTKLWATEATLIQKVISAFKIEITKKPLKQIHNVLLNSNSSSKKKQKELDENSLWILTLFNKASLYLKIDVYIIEKG